MFPSFEEDGIAIGFAVGFRYKFPCQNSQKYTNKAKRSEHSVDTDGFFHPRCHLENEKMQSIKAKNDSIQSKQNSSFEIAALFPRRTGDAKEWQFQNWIFFE